MNKNNENQSHTKIPFILFEGVTKYIMQNELNHKKYKKEKK